MKRHLQKIAIRKKAMPVVTGISLTFTDSMAPARYRKIANSWFLNNAPQRLAPVQGLATKSKD